MIKICIGSSEHVKHASEICQLIHDAAQLRGTGIALRTPEYISLKLKNGMAVVALDDEVVAGFCYIEAWQHQRYVANSGLIVNPIYRNLGLAKKIKKAIFKLSLKKFPGSMIFGITTSHAVMKINSDLGYKPVHFSSLTNDEQFWAGCKSCPNYDILTRTQKSMCLCTAMLYQGHVQNPKAKSLGQSVKVQWETLKPELHFRRYTAKTKNLKPLLLNPEE